MSEFNDGCIQYPYKSETDTSSDKELWYVSVPAVDYIREAFFGAISTLGFPDSYNPMSDQAAEYGSEIVASLTQIVPPRGVGLLESQAHITLWHIFSTVHQGNAIIGQTNAAQFWHLQSPAANNDQWSLPFRAGAGIYEMNVLYWKSTQNGITELKILDSNGATIATLSPTIDMWASAFTGNQVQQYNFTLANDGDYEVHSRVTGKNGSSGGYQIPISMIYLRKR